VANHPDQSTYFQPVLDVLNYQPSKLENVPKVVMLEGKNDFYTLNYLGNILHKKNFNLNLLPGGGAGSLDDLIRLYIAWGRDFIVLLDSDAEGNSQIIRYRDLFGSLVEDKIFSLGDIDEKWNGMGMEHLLGENDCLSIQMAVYPDTKKFSKKNFNRAIQELHLKNHSVSLSQAVEEKLEKIIGFCKTKLSL
jgi:hypothetical protein